MLARQSVLAALAALAAGLVACGDARPVSGGACSAQCVTCHGGTDNCTGAPPLDTAARSDTALRSVGAHTSHVEAGPVAGAFDCGECHFPKPTSIDSPGHRDETVQVVFGALAGTGTASPVWNGGATPPTCSSVYCHGATLGGGAGTILTPAWTTVDGSQASCGTCHRLPPSGHAPLTAGFTNQTCAVCHDQTVRAADGLIDVPQGKHVNGQLDVLADAQHPAGWIDEASVDFHAYQVNSRGPASCQTCHAFQPPAQLTTVVCSTCHNGTVAPSLATCTGCHGGTDNLTGAPPRTTWGNGADAVRVGAHTSHVEGTHNIANPVACNECHVLPADAFAAGHIDVSGTQTPADLTWGTLATSGGASPQWTRTPAPTCSATYCHGNFTNGNPASAPVWTGTGQAACGTCHDLPPDTGHHYRHVFSEGRNCSDCHEGIATGSGNAAPITNGAILAGGKALHVNGAKNVILSTGRTWDGTGWYSGCGTSVCH